MPTPATTLADTADNGALHRHQTYLATGYFQNLNGLRFLCIAMVLWHHAQPVHLDGWQILDRGFLGVDFFFVLSGFLITTLLLRERARFGEFSLRDFYVRRILRIVPVYFFVVTLVSFLYIFGKGQTQYLELLPFYYLFLSNFLTEHIPTLSITWSLSVEEQYYMLWPLCLLMLPSRWIVPALVALIALNVAIGAGVFGIAPPALGPLLIKMPNATYAPILIGSLLAFLLHTASGYAILDRILGARWVSVLCAVLCLLAIQLTPHDLHGWPNLLIHVSMAGLLATLVLQENTVWSPFLTNTVIARIGEISYGIYLYHLLGLHIANVLGLGGSWVLLFGYSLISIIVADISFRTLESWFLSKRPKRSALAD